MPSDSQPARAANPSAAGAGGVGGRPAGPHRRPCPRTTTAVATVSPLTLTGTAEAGTVVHVLGGASAAQATVSPAGTFSVTVPLVLQATNALEVHVQRGALVSATVTVTVVHTTAVPAPYLGVPAGEWETGCYVMRFAESTLEANMPSIALAIAAAAGATVDNLWLPPVAGFSVSGFPAFEAVSIAQSDSRIRYVEECPRVHLYFVQDTVGVTYKDLDRLDLHSRTRDNLFRRTGTGIGQHVYVIDTGINITGNTLGAEFGGRVVNEFTQFPPSFSDQGNHGTQMAVLIGGSTRGVATKVTLHNMKAFTGVGPGGYPGIIGALRHLHMTAGLPKGIVNMSLGVQMSPMSSDVTTMKENIDLVVAAGFLVVAAAGNENAPVEGATTVTIPAAYPNVLTVSGVDYTNPASDPRWDSGPGSGANFGPAVDIFAPAFNVATFANNGNPTAAVGTSGAAALTSGVLAALMELRPTATMAQLRQELLDKANTFPVGDAQSPNAKGQLYSDMGVLKTNRVVTSTGAATATCAGQTAAKTVTARASTFNAIYVAYSVLPSWFCPGTRITNQPIHFLIEKRDNFGALIWERLISDPTPTNSYVNDGVMDLAYAEINGQPRLLLAVSTVDDTRFIASMSHTSSPGGVDTYVVALNADDAPTARGAQVWASRIGGPGLDIPRAIVVSSRFSNNTTGQKVVVVGITTGGIGMPAVDQNDAFLWMGELSTGVKPAMGGFLQLGWPGRIRIEDAAVVEGLGGTPQRVMVVGGTSHDISTGMALGTDDSMKFEASFPTGSIGISNRLTISRANDDSDGRLVYCRHQRLSAGGRDVDGAHVLRQRGAAVATSSPAGRTRTTGTTR